MIELTPLLSFFCCFASWGPAASRHVDWSHANGLWIPCAGSVSPWNTHIGGEEYEPDAKFFSPSLYQNDSSICGSSHGVCTSIECAPDTITSSSATVWNQCSELREAYAFAKYFSDGEAGPLYPQDIAGIQELREIINPVSKWNQSIHWMLTLIVPFRCVCVTNLTLLLFVL